MHDLVLNSVLPCLCYFKSSDLVDYTEDISVIINQFLRGHD